MDHVDQGHASVIALIGKCGSEPHLDLSFLGRELLCDPWFGFRCHLFDTVPDIDGGSRDMVFYLPTSCSTWSMEQEELQTVPG